MSDVLADTPTDFAAIFSDCFFKDFILWLAFLVADFQKETESFEKVWLWLDLNRLVFTENIRLSHRLFES